MKPLYDSSVVCTLFWKIFDGQKVTIPTDVLSLSLSPFFLLRTVRSLTSWLYRLMLIALRRDCLLNFLNLCIA